MYMYYQCYGHDLQIKIFQTANILQDVQLGYIRTNGNHSTGNTEMSIHPDFT